MKHLTPVKRNQLIMVGLATLAVLGGLYSLLIFPQTTKNTEMAGQNTAAKAKLELQQTSIKQAETIASEVTGSALKLERAEQDIATGDVYQWMFDLLRRFKVAYNLDIPNISQPLGSKMDLLADFPYEQIKVTLNGTGYFHDLGKFIADFENTYPHMRVVNLSIEPAAGAPGSALAERVTFRFDLVALVKPKK